MSKSSSDEELLEKIHQILDDSSAESEKKRHDRNLSSLERRLSHDHGLRYSTRPSHQSDDKDLTPRVVIRKKQKPAHQKKTEGGKKVVEFKEEKEDNRIIPADDLHLSDNELFEVEKPSIRAEEIPEFIEVKPEQKEEIEEPIFKEQSYPEEEPLTITISSESETEEESLPQWEAVDESEEQEKKALVKKPLTERKKKSFFKPQKEQNDKKESFAESEKDSFKKIGKKSDEIWEPLDEKKEKSSFDSKTKRVEKISKKQSEEKQVKNEKKTQSDSPGFNYNDYTLFQKTIKINDKEKRTIHFFAKEPPETGVPAELPKDYEVKINRKTGVPYIRKKQQ
ncbi:MAG: hypothetical protein KGY65_01870 [Candidatus Thermoplasmatota archaeon]|nr:hypothetical protein [Candidatus Thermoplasmatota archaeon]MBS3801476.1 hypothetical protein [Candidatus Thermoplasmatota archaeon]